MRGRRLEAWIEPLAFREPLRIAGRTLPGIPGVRVRIVEGQAAGRGEAGGVFYLGDGPDAMLAAIEEVRAEIERGLDRGRLQALLPAGGARNALDAALWELEAALAGEPVWRMAGLPQPRPLVTTCTLGADPPDVLAARLAAFREARAFKLKLEGDLEADRERLALIRKAWPDAWLMADGNEGYRADQLEALFSTLVRFGVSLLEQPLPRGQDEVLAGCNPPLPVAADESLQGLADLEGLVGRYQVANIKLDKCGGLTEGLKMVAVARRLGLRLMIGNMGGSSLAAAPAWLLAQVCDYVDLDGPIFLAADVPGGARYENGLVDMPDDFWGTGSPPD
ncbi:dipeptide epimerase [Brevundimonas naejangsanensis]|uniref:Dipeptide epimerase n=1 Tax=Brevundimonas naejangsanensis TaxID=588932 RepID=A0A172Y4B3_9CAUL|nr:dipeptide epimerase [Brevundimonas naejangsanensis]ANF54050.1 dipeptide epimerase [Brevundimonas naejangsanensis]